MSQNTVEKEVCVFQSICVRKNFLNCIYKL